MHNLHFIFPILIDFLIKEKKIKKKKGLTLLNKKARNGQKNLITKF